MTFLARSVFSEEPESMDAGREAGQTLLSQFGAEYPKVALVYATMNHDQPAVLQGLREVLGKDTVLLGCSTQGVVSDAFLTEDGYAVAVMGFGGGDLICAA